jgi:dolichyl-phosphate beta-glucosyltransferase
MANAKIIIPCYNEEHRLDVAAFQNFKSVSHEITFLFVNDGSTDRTLGILESLQGRDGSRFSVLDLQPNKGKAEAVRQGILTAIKPEPDYVGFWDADLATPLDAITDFLDLARIRPELEIIMGARVKLLGRRIERRASRHYIGRAFATVVSTMLGLAVYDTQCGAKLFRVTPSIKGLFQEPFLSRWIFDVEILARLIRSHRGKCLSRLEQAIYEFPLLEWKDVPGSKLSYGDFIRAAWELCRIHQRYFVAERR